MKRFVIHTVFVLAALSVCGQIAPYPGCNELTVTSVSVSGSGTMTVNLHNSCANCASGMDGCVYYELKVIRDVAPFDTLGESDCFCHVTPANQSSKTYTIKGYVSNLPPAGQMRVSLFCGTGSCEDIPHAITSTEKNSGNGTVFYPNPVSDILRMEFGPSPPRTISLYNVHGQLLLTQPVSAQHESVNMTGLPVGIYILITGYADGHATAHKLFRH